jgi:hypothetical protein
MRDFRDAKTMAHALRDALQTKAVETTHSECLELIAKAFGDENWNILSARIAAARSRAPDAPALAPADVHEPAPPKTLHCSFCGKSQHAVRCLIAGPTVFICDECVAICDEILADQEIGNEACPAAFEHLRGKSTEEVAACTERNRKGAERTRVEVRNIQRVLAMRDGELPAEPDVLASPRFAAKTRADLVVLQQQAERLLKRYENVLRIAATVLDTRGP